MADALSQEQIQDLKEAFAMFDKDGSDTIEASELAMVLQSLGDRTSQTVSQDVLDAFDTDSNRRISFDEFIKVMASKLTKSNADQRDLMEAFRVFDRNGDGKISVAELSAVMKSLGETFDDAEINAMIREGDTDGDGEVVYEEFVKMMAGK